MFPQKSSIAGSVESKNYPLGEQNEQPHHSYSLALVSLSHTPVEQRLYSAMLSAVPEASGEKVFTTRSLTTLTGIRSLSTIRRALEGLLTKLSIERSSKNGANGKGQQGSSYRVFLPAEIIARRKQLGSLVSDESHNGKRNHAFDRAVARVAENVRLSRREAQVALCCVEGLTNAEIGKRLDVREQTVKFHLRHVFVKFGVRRRAELISRLLA